MSAAGHTSPWLDAARWRKAALFLGPRTTRLLALGALAGLGLFAAEAAFAYALQAFLLGLGVMSSQAAALPAWLERLGLPGMLGLLVVAGSLRGLLIGAQSYMQGAANEELSYLARARLLERTFRSESASTSEVSALFNARTVAAGVAIANVQTFAIQAVAALLLGASLLAMAPLLSLGVFAALSLLVWPLRWADRRIKETGEGLRSEWDKTNARLLVSIKNLLLLQIYGTLEEEEAKARVNLTAYRDHVVFFYVLNGVKYAIPQILGVFLICLVALSAKSGLGVPPGLLVCYFYLMLRFLQIFTSLSQSASGIILHWPQLDHLYRWWEGEFHAAPAGPAPAASRPQPLDHLVGWRLSGVSFAYPGGEAPVIKDLSLTVEPGKTLVIQGPSGVGKSTLLNLMLGGLKPGSGAIEVLVNGGRSQPLEECRPRLLRSIGYVGPESFLIEGTILQNVVYGLDRSPAAAEVKDAIEKAECQFVFSLPKGLEHRLTEQGQGLSAGQKQRLSLVRALLRDPKVLILDEATSNLDHDTESRIVSTLSKLKERMTIIAVTHRRELLRIADSSIHLNGSSEAP